MSRAFDAIVIGAGPAGAEAAVTAAAHGRNIALIDEQPAAGGQVWRAPIGGFPGKGDGAARAGDDLRHRLASSSVGVFFGHRAWSIVHQGDEARRVFRIDALGPDGNVALSAPALVVATGAHERVTPFPGWTLPGVIGLAAATILLKSQGIAPGKRVVVAGCGPLLWAVAAGLTKTGVEVVAVADLSRRDQWLTRLPSILRQPSLALEGAAWMARIALSGTPVFWGHGIRYAEGKGEVSRVTIGPVDAEGAPVAGQEQCFDIDTLVVGHGLTTASEITRLLRARHRHDRRRGGWIPEVDGSFETSVPALYAIGDGAGVRGQRLATLAGRRVGLTLAGRPSDAAAMNADIMREARFSDSMADLMAQRPAQVAAIASDTVVCRCEDVTRREIDEAIGAGADEINQLKHFTRCGMGPCQGRYCGDTVEELMAQKLARERGLIGQWTGRPPLRPVMLGELIGDFRYDDIPIPEPAPL